jgi:hypothetical protein
MPSVVDRPVRRAPELQTAAEEAHYLIVLEGSFPSEPIEPFDAANLPKELVGAYLMG